MAITFNSTGYNAAIPGFGNPTSAAAPSTTLSYNTSPVSTTPLSQLYANAQSQFSVSPGQNLSYSEDPRLTSMLQLLMQRANQSDAEINAQADDAYAAQRKYADIGLNRDVTRSLAANGVLPTGGLAAQMRQELSDPVYARLDAQRAQTLLDLRNARDSVRSGVTGTLAGVDNNRNQFALSNAENQRQAQFQSQQLASTQAYQQAQLQQQAALAAQQLESERQRAQLSQSLAQQQLDYEKQRDAQNLAFQREQLAAQNQRFYSGGGSNNGSVGSSGGSMGYNLDLGAGMQENYQRMNASENLRSGRNADGSYNQASSTWAINQTPSQARSSNSSTQVQNPATARDAFSMGPTAQSFYVAPASGSNFESPGSMFGLGFRY